PDPVPSGKVEAFANGVNIGIGTLDANGHVDFTTLPLAAGTNYVYVVYEGDNNFAGVASDKFTFAAADKTPPASQVNAFKATTQDSEDLHLTWSGDDGITGSGIANYDIFVSDNGAAYKAFLSKTSATSGTFVGTYGHSYRFYSVARDTAGNVEA